MFQGQSLGPELRDHLTSGKVQGEPMTLINLGEWWSLSISARQGGRATMAQTRPDGTPDGHGKDSTHHWKDAGMVPGGIAELLLARESFVSLRVPTKYV